MDDDEMRVLAKIVIMLAFLLFGYLTQSLLPLFVSEIPITTPLYAIEDAKTRYKAPTTNYGTGSIATIEMDANVPDFSYFWMKFDLATIPTIASMSGATVKIYVESVWKAGQYELHYGWSDTWGETSITWSNQPGFDVGAYTTWYIDSAGYWEFSVGLDKLALALASDKKISYVLTYNQDLPINPTYNTEINLRTREYAGSQPTLMITYAVPKYTLTVNLRDQNGNPIDGIVAVMKDATQVASGSSTGGTFTTTLEHGTYSVEAFYQAQSQQTTVTLDSPKTVTLTFTAGPPPTGAYTLTINVKDQIGNPLKALVLIDSTSKTADFTGKVTHDVSAPTTVSVKASIQVGARTFESSQTILIDQTKTVTVTITRRFLVKFFLNYTDGSLAAGSLFITNKESLNIPIANGRGEAYLLDGKYTLSFSASPAIDLGALEIKNDADVYGTINKEESVLTEPITTTTTPAVTTPSYPSFLLISGIYIYILIGAIVILGVIGIIVQILRKGRR